MRSTAMLFAMGIAVTALCATREAYGTIWVVNESNSEVTVCVLQAYVGSTQNDGNLICRPAFRLKPGESREIGAKFMSTNTFWLAVSQLRRNSDGTESGSIRVSQDQKWEFNNRGFARISVESIWMPTNLNSKHDNAFVAKQMRAGNWEPLKSLMGENKLANIKVTRISPTLPHGSDPGFSIKVNNSNVTLRRVW